MVFYERATHQPGFAVNDRRGIGQGFYCYRVNKKSLTYIKANEFAINTLKLVIHGYIIDKFPILQSLPVLFKRLPAMTRFLLPVVLFGLFSCTNNNRPGTDMPASIPVENITATKDQQERRNQSDAFCKAHGIPVYSNPNALFVAPEDSVTLRTKDEVVDRALALCYIGLKSEGLEQAHLDKMARDYRIVDKLTASEKAYANAKAPTEQQKVDANWRYESLHIMLWALGFIDTLSYPDQLCNVANDVKFIIGQTEQQFREKARLRTKKEILDQADLVLRLDWACVSARLENKPAPGRLDKSVVYERHYSLNWLIRYLEQDWDNVSADT